MTVVVSVADIVSEMVETSDDQITLLNRRTGELFTVTEEQRSAVDNEHPVGDLTEFERQLREADRNGDIVELPTKFEHHEYSVVERFCYSVQDRDHRDKLLKAIQGNRAFRDFHQAIQMLGRKDQWCSFRDRVFEAIAIGWLEKHQIPHDRKSAA